MAINHPSSNASLSSCRCHFDDQYLPTWIMSGGTLMTLPLIIFPFASSGNASMVAVYCLWFFVPVIVLVLIYYVFLKWYNKRGFDQKRCSDAENR